MQRYFYYFKQAVANTELNEGFAGAENALFELAGDVGFEGVVSGAGVNQHAGTPNLTVDVGGNAAIYDQLGERIAWAGIQNVDVSKDSNGVNTAVVTSGNEKYVSVFAQFVRVLSDPRVDGNSNTIYFNQAEGFQFLVVQGAEAALGTAAKPSLVSPGILLADIHLVFGQTQVHNADIGITRRQDAVVITGTPLAIREGQLLAGLTDVVNFLNSFIAGSSGTLPASAVAYAGGPAWADGTTNPAATVQAQLSKLVSDLAGSAGTAKIEGEAASGTRFSLIAENLALQIAALQTRIDGMMTTGIDTIQQVASIAALRAIGSASRPTNVVVAVKDIGLFVYDAASAAVDDAVRVVAPTDVGAGAGRWILSFYGARNMVSYFDEHYTEPASDVISMSGGIQLFSTTQTFTGVLTGDVFDLNAEFEITALGAAGLTLLVDFLQSGAAFETNPWAATTESSGPDLMSYTHRKRYIATSADQSAGSVVFQVRVQETGGTGAVDMKLGTLWCRRWRP